MSNHQREPEDPVEGAIPHPSQFMRIPTLGWDTYFLKMAEVVAMRSKDASTQVGAVIVADKRILSTGYNGIPRGVRDSQPGLPSTNHVRFVPPVKYFWLEHAERNAIYAAARFGIPLVGASIYVWASRPLAVCADCARGIIQSGITDVYGYQLTENDQSVWGESSRIAQQMMLEADLTLHLRKS